MNKSEKKIRGRPRSTKVDQAILKATLEILGEVGFASMSIESISARAGVGKSTIYRRYQGKAELVADAIENMRQDVVIPDTGNFRSDLDELVKNTAQITFTPVGRQTVAMIISSAYSDTQFAQIYVTKYLIPRREAFAIIIERAKSRQEIQTNIDSDLIFDTLSAIMLYALIFPPQDESWTDYVRRALDLLFSKVVNDS